MSVLSTNLRFCREKLCYTQEEIGRYLGISQPAYNKYERGESVPSIEQLEKIAALFGVEEYALLHATEEQLTPTLAFAFRKGGPIEDLNDLASFKKIVNNYLFLCNELSEN